MSAVVTFETLDEEAIDELLDTQDADDEGGRALLCAACRQRVTSRSERIAQGGSHEHTFRNPSGFAFHIGCFRSAPGCEQLGAATEAWTWFAGHAWRVAVCRSCGGHLGWEYRPRGGGEGFYGLILDRLVEEPAAPDA